MLAECIALHEPAMRASFLAEYHAHYSSFELLEAADLLAWLPAGAAVWRSVGGPMALTTTEHSLRVVDYRLQVLAWQQTEDAKHKRNQPKPPEKVPYAHEVVEVESYALRQAEARQRRARVRG